MSGNLFENYLPAVDGAQSETFEDLFSRPDVRIERIVSTGQASPPDFWYCQPQGEWVVVLRGSASLWIEGEEAPRVLQPGDFVDLPAQCRHRVEWTDPDMPTVWLAVHYGMLDPAL